MGQQSHFSRQKGNRRKKDVPFRWVFVVTNRKVSHNGREPSKKTDIAQESCSIIFFISFYLWSNFLNLMIGLSCSLFRLSYRLLMAYLFFFFQTSSTYSSSQLQSPIHINNIHQCLNKIYGLIIAFGRLHTRLYLIREGKIYEAYLQTIFMYIRLPLLPLRFPSLIWYSEQNDAYG